jgi:hypothetical protein
MIALIMALVAVATNWTPQMPADFIDAVIRCERPLVQPEFIGCETSAPDGDYWWGGLAIHPDGTWEFVTGP